MHEGKVPSLASSRGSHQRSLYRPELNWVHVDLNSKEKRNYIGRRNSPYINQGEGKDRTVLDCCMPSLRRGYGIIGSEEP
eukprot:523785-Pelagomonas_calceolata.AAC.2